MTQDVNKENLTVAELDALVLDYASKRGAYEEAKEISNEREREKAKAEFKLLEALKSHNKKTYSVDGLGVVARREKLAIRIPSGERKIEFFKYLQGRGEDFFLNFITVNYNSLNSFYNSELEAAEAAGVFPFSLPGIEEPILTEGITFRRDKSHGN